MAASKNAPNLKPDPLLERLLPDASQTPDVRVLVGLLGKSTRDGHWRLYLTLTLNEYVEFAEDDVVHSHTFERDESQLGGTAIWLKREANTHHTKSVSREAQADFLHGAITSGALKRLDPCKIQAVPAQQAIFLSFEGRANSCVSDICDLMAPSFMSGGDVLCTFSC